MTEVQGRPQVTRGDVATINQTDLRQTVQGVQAEFIPEFWEGENPSGIRVHGKNVLICADAAAKVTSAGVHMTDDHVERMTMSSETGVIVHVGPEAFQYHDDGKPWRGEKPMVGDRCYFERHAGILHMGLDGKVYRIMDYRCIGATLDMTNAKVVAWVNGQRAARGLPPLVSNPQQAELLERRIDARLAGPEDPEENEGPREFLRMQEA